MLRNDQSHVFKTDHERKMFLIMNKVVVVLLFSYSQIDTLELAGESENKPNIKPHSDTLEFYLLSAFIPV